MNSDDFENFLKLQRERASSQKAEYTKLKKTEKEAEQLNKKRDKQNELLQTEIDSRKQDKKLKKCITIIT